MPPGGSVPLSQNPCGGHVTDIFRLLFAEDMARQRTSGTQDSSISSVCVNNRETLGFCPGGWAEN